MPPPILVVGHRNPDTDSICAALGYADLLRRQRAEPVVAGRLGPLRPETAYLLERFHLDPPDLVEDVRNRVGDVMTSGPVTVPEGASLYEVGLQQRTLGMRPLPVVDSEGRLCGIVEPADFAKVFFEGLDAAHSDEVTIDVDNLVRALDARVLVTAEERTVQRRVMVAAWSFDSIRERLAPDMVLVVGDRVDVQKAAIELGVGMLIVTGGNPVPDEVVRLARQRRVHVMAVEHHTAATLRLVYMSVPVTEIMRCDAPSCEPDDLVDDVRDLLTAERALSVVDGGRRVVGVITRRDVLRAPPRRVVLVDHNERGQSVEGIEQAEIVGVVDHHRIADVQTVHPPFVRIEPLGACSTLVAKLYAEAGIRIPGPLAGALLGAILADTLLFKSPTTTPDDRRIAAELGRLASVDPDELGRELIAIQSDVSHRTAAELVKSDFKSFGVDDFRFGIGVIETGNAAPTLDRARELLAAMRQLRRAEGYTSVILAVADIVGETTTLLVDGHPSRVARAFGAEVGPDGAFRLPGVYSRKKQIVPRLPAIRDLIKGAP